MSQQLILAQRVRSDIVLGIHAFFQDREYIYVAPPILHESIANKKREIYLQELDNRYSLNSSNALYLSAYASQFEKVYSISPTFRKENDLQNHMIEFRMLEVETVGMTFAAMIEFIQELLVFLLDYVAHCKTATIYDGLANRITSLKSYFPLKCINYSDFTKNLWENTARYDYLNTDISDIDYLVTKSLEAPVIVIGYPTRWASWTAKSEDQVSLALNLLLPNTFGELCEGCERINNIEILHNKFKCAGITNLDWYLDVVKMISKPRSGFGIGVDRLIRWIIDADSIAETVFFLR